MSLAACTVPTQPARWRRDAHATDGCTVTVDGRDVLRVGVRAVYRADVDTAARTVFLIADGRALEFNCRASGDARRPERPAGDFGWTAGSVDRPDIAVAVRVGHVLTVCLQDRDATAAVEQITRAVADEGRATAATLRGDAPPGPAGREQRAAADAWHSAAARLETGLETAAALRRVPVRPLRDEFLRQLARGQITASTLGARAGWHWRASPGRRAHGDSARVLRRLGLSPDPSDRRETARRRCASPAERELLDDLDDITATMSYDIAVKLCRGLRRDPADFGWL